MNVEERARRAAAAIEGIEKIVRKVESGEMSPERAHRILQRKKHRLVVGSISVWLDRKTLDLFDRYAPGPSGFLSPPPSSVRPRVNVKIDHRRATVGKRRFAAPHN